MMPPTVLVWLKFALCVGLIGLAGTRLSRYADVIAEKTGLSGTWIGVIMLASVTSLPELITGVSAVTLVQAPNLAVGDVLGSCVFNLFIIVVLDLLYRRESLYMRASQGHILSAGFGILLIGFTGCSILLSLRGGVIAVGHIGIYSLVIVVLYALAMRTIFSYEKKRMNESTEQIVELYGTLTLYKSVVGYVARRPGDRRGGHLASFCGWGDC